MSYCASRGISVGICTELHQAFRLPFCEVFSLVQSSGLDYTSAADRVDLLVIEGDRVRLSDIKLGYRNGQSYAIVHKKTGKEYTASTHLNSPCICTDLSGNEVILTAGTYGMSSQGPRPSSYDSFYSFATYACVSPEITAAISAQCQSLPNSFIAVHFRNTDLKHPLDETIERIRLVIKDEHIDTIYWATDEAESLSRASEAFPSQKIINFSSIPTLGPNQKCLHYLNDKALSETGVSKRTQIIDALQDIYVLSLAKHFIDSPRSSLSRFVKWLREDGDRSKAFFGREARKDADLIHIVHNKQ